MKNESNRMLLKGMVNSLLSVIVSISIPSASPADVSYFLDFIISCVKMKSKINIAINSKSFHIGTLDLSV